MSTPSIQPDEETMRRNLAITLQQQQPPQANPLEPQMAAPGPIDLPNQPKAPDMSIFPASKPPVVFGPFGQGGKGMAQRGTPEGDKQEIQRLSSTGSGVSQIPGRIESAMPNHPVLGKVLGQGAGILGRIGDAILSNLPGSLNGVGKGIESMIPGTQGYHQAQLGQATGQLNNETANAEKEAQAGNLQEEGNLHKQQARAAELTPATLEEAPGLGVPEGTMLNAASRAALTKQAGINSTRVQTTGMNVQGRQDIADANNLTKEKVATLKPEQRDDHAIRLMQISPEQRTQQDNAYLASYSRWIDQTKTQPGVARAAAFGAFRPVQAIDANGDVHYEFAGNAIKSGASSPSSMNFRTAVGMSKYMTSGKGGGFITAYNVANDHLDLFGKAMNALQNGDTQALTQMSNAWKQQFGSAVPTNVNAVRTMLAGELGNVAKLTGAIDPELKEQRDNISRNYSDEQVRGFIETNHDLMDQKAYEMYQQYQTGMQGKPAFGTGRPLNGPGGAGGGQPADPNPNNVKPGYRRTYVEGHGWGSVPNA